MSDNKRRKIQLRSDLKIKRSFDERVCDDLCEELLQYLPFEDKLKLESVSKQFQRNIYKRQYELVMDYTLKNQLKTNNGRKPTTFNATAFKTILKKCPNIKTINLMNFYYSSHQKSFVAEYNKIIDIITKNCHKLQDFELYVKKLRPKTIDRFRQKFATKLSSIRFLHSDELFDKKLLTSLTNIKDLSLNSYSPFGLSHVFDNNNHCLVRNLRRLSLNYDMNDLKLFELLVKSNPHLKILDINSYNTDQISLSQLLSQISNLSDLRQLNIITDFELTDKCVAKSMKQMADKCPLIKKIHFNLFVDNESHHLVLEIIDSLKHFKQLKRIHLSLDSEFQLDLSADQTSISAKHLSVCKELTELSLYSNEVGDNFFKDIGALLPGLKFLHILNANITESTLEELAKLRSIQKLAFYRKYSMAHINEESVEEMYVKCPKLKSIKFRP